MEQLNMLSGGGLPVGFEAPDAINFISAGVGRPVSSKQTERVVFYWAEEDDEFQSKEQNKRVTHRHEYVRIDFPHDPKGNYDSRATEFLKRKYAREYVMFKNGVKQEVGTPIEKVGFISPNEMASLQVLGIRSLEQITSLDSVAIASLGVNGKYLKEQAQRYLDHQAQERSQLLKSEANKDLEAKVAQLTAQIEALTKASKTTEVVTEEKETKKSK